MTWDEVRAQYPKTWLVIEVTSARTESAHRMVDQMEAVAVCDSGLEAWELQAALRMASPARELYAVHTDRKELEIEVREEPVLRGVRIG